MKKLLMRSFRMGMGVIVLVLRFVVGLLVEMFIRVFVVV